MTGSGGASVGIMGRVSTGGDCVNSVVGSFGVGEFCNDLFTRDSIFSPGLFEIIRVAVTASTTPAIIPIFTSFRIVPCLVKLS